MLYASALHSRVTKTPRTRSTDRLRPSGKESPGSHSPSPGHHTLKYTKCALERKR